MQGNKAMKKKQQPASAPKKSQTVITSITKTKSIKAPKQATDIATKIVTPQVIIGSSSNSNAGGSDAIANSSDTSIGREKAPRPSLKGLLKKGQDVSALVLKKNPRNKHQEHSQSVNQTYVISLQNVNTKQQTYATIQETKVWDPETRSFHYWTEEFSEQYHRNRHNLSQQNTSSVTSHKVKKDNSNISTTQDGARYTFACQSLPVEEQEETYSSQPALLPRKSLKSPRQSNSRKLQHLTAEIAELDAMRLRNNQSCTERYGSRKTVAYLANPAIMFSSLDSCKSKKSTKQIRNSNKEIVSKPKNSKKIVNANKEPASKKSLKNKGAIKPIKLTNLSLIERDSEKQVKSARSSLGGGGPNASQRPTKNIQITDKLKSPKARKIEGLQIFEKRPRAQTPQPMNMNQHYLLTTYQDQDQKITQLSQEQLQCSLVKSKTLSNNRYKEPMIVPEPVQSLLIFNEPTVQRSFKKKPSAAGTFTNLSILKKVAKKMALTSKIQASRSLKKNIQQKVSSNYPGLQPTESRLLVAIIMIQRLWRQRKVKSIIGMFLSPNSSFARTAISKPKLDKTIKPILPPYKLKIGSLQCSSSSEQKILQTPTHRTHSISNKSSLQLQPDGYKTPSRKTDNQKSNNIQAMAASSLSGSSKSSAQSYREAQMARFVDSYREIVLDSKKNKKVNYFSLSSSLSDQCLMEKFYKKLNNSQTKKHLQFMKVKQKLSHSGSKDQFSKMSPLHENSKQMEEQIVASIFSIESTERFYTQTKDQLQASKQVVQRVQEKPQILPLSPIKQPVIQQASQTKTNSDLIAQGVVQLLIDEFLDEFVKYSKKMQNLKKKKLPGIRVSKEAVKEYLNGLVDFISTYYKRSVINNLNKIIGVKPSMLLKLFRKDPNSEAEDYQEQDYFGQEDQYNRQPVLPNNKVFCEYQEVFQTSITLKKQEEKYSNFLNVILKIHTKSLLDCFTENLDSLRRFGANGRPYPWQPYYKQFRRNYPAIVDKDFNSKMKESKEMVLECCSFRLGNLDKSMAYYSAIEEQNLMVMISQEFSKQQEQWSSCPEQTLELTLDLCTYVYEFLLSEAVSEIRQCFVLSPPLKI